MKNKRLDKSETDGATCQTVPERIRGANPGPHWSISTEDPWRVNLKAS